MTSKGHSINCFVKEYASSNNDNLWKKMDNTKITLKDSKKDLYLESDIIIKGTIQNPSDLNLKTNIKVISKNETNLINNLSPVTYEYISDENKQSHYGLIAQNVEKYYPNLVKKDMSSNYNSVNYIELIPILIAKVQDLEREIENLKSKI